MSPHHAIVRRRVGRRRPKLVAFTDRVGTSLRVMVDSFRLGIEAPAERRDEYRGAGRALEW